MKLRTGLRGRRGNSYRRVPQVCRVQPHAVPCVLLSHCVILERKLSQPLAKSDDHCWTPYPLAVLCHPEGSHAPHSSFAQISILLVPDNTTLISRDQMHRKCPRSLPSVGLLGWIASARLSNNHAFGQLPPWLKGKSDPMTRLC